MFRLFDERMPGINCGVRCFSGAIPSKNELEFINKFLETIKKSPECYAKSVYESGSSRDMSRYNVLSYLKSESSFYQTASEDERIEMQRYVEVLSLSPQLYNLYKIMPDIFNLLINKELESAKQILLNDSYGNIVRTRILLQLDEYTLEAASVFTLCNLFHVCSKSTLVRAATFIDSLAHTIQYHYSVSSSRKFALGDKIEHEKEELQLITESKKLHQTKLGTKSKAKKVKPLSKASEFLRIASFVLELLIDRGVVKLVDDIIEQDKPVVKKKGSYYKESPLYIQCLFDLKMIPTKMLLPMICPPLPWSIKSSSLHKYEGKENKMVSFSDMNGGYLTYDSSQIMTRYQLLTSRHYDNFNMKLKNMESCLRYCRIITKLQDTPFKVNKEMLNWIREHRQSLEEKGILMPSFLSNILIHVVYERLRKEVSMANSKDLVFSNLATILDKLIQRARYEDFIINLATALEEYTFWFPAFIDFRGRIYRTGILNFHERDLARSLLLFSSNKEDQSLGISIDSISDSLELSNETYRSLVCAAYAHYKSPTSITSSYQWLIQHCIRSEDHSSVTPTEIIDLASESKSPFLFIASVNRFLRQHLRGDLPIDSTPISMDASSSAYQILSYFLLDEDLAQRTNLIGGDGDTIQDLYTSLIDPLSAYLQKGLTPPLGEVVSTRITRKLIKRVYMPLVYGKGLMSSAQDISEAMYEILKRNELLIVSTSFFRFWFDKYPQIKNLMTLINLGGWFAATLNRPVSYHTQYFQSIQDYMKTESVNVFVFDRNKKKRKKISLSIPSTTRDRGKTQRACFANFIHQKDASIALFIIDNFTHSHLYTVHDNFIVNPNQTNNINHCYISAIQSLGDPLSQVNHFLFNNIIVHSSECSELSSSSITSLSTSQPHKESPISTFLNMESPFSNNLSSTDSLLPLLERALQDIEPKELKSKDKAIWDNKVKMIVESYSSYVRSLNYQGAEYVGYANKYKSFLEKLNNKDSSSFALHP